MGQRNHLPPLTLPERHCIVPPMPGTKDPETHLADHHVEHW
jgi:hypothetical protein